jgi:hypothetical protein
MKKELTDTQVKEIVKIIDLANKLSKVDPEYKNRLYEIKHYILNYILTKKKYLVESIIPMMNGSHKLLEVKIEGFIFHVPYHKKQTYGFDWDKDTNPILYIKPEETEVQKEALQKFKSSEIFKDLFQIYVYLHSGVSHIASGTIRYWYTQYILRKLYNNEKLEFLREDDNPEVTNIPPRTGLRFKLVWQDGNILKVNWFTKFFAIAVKSYSNYFKKSVNSICKEYEQKL